VTGALLWVGGCVLAGYLFGNIPVVRENFTLVLLAIVFLSILPALIGFVNSRRQPATVGEGQPGTGPEISQP
jgi:membrane-associated protein